MPGQKGRRWEIWGPQAQRTEGPWHTGGTSAWGWARMGSRVWGEPCDEVGQSHGHSESQERAQEGDRERLPSLPPHSLLPEMKIVHFFASFSKMSTSEWCFTCDPIWNVNTPHTFIPFRSSLTFLLSALPACDILCILSVSFAFSLF